MEEITDKQIEEKASEEAEKDKENVIKNIKAAKYNRATKRRMAKGIHHNVFTKKYKNDDSKEKSWRNLYKEEDYIMIKRTQKKLINPNYKMPVPEQKNFKNTLFKPQKVG